MIEDRPSILLITTDQLRADALGCYGNPRIQTPNLDRLAASGTRLDRAYVANPLCMPARASLLTGRFPSAHRVRNNGVPLPEGERTVADILGDAGYATSLVGKAHLQPYFADAGSRESLRLWESGENDRWHGPYYGFQHVELTLSHHRPAGHYGDWLRSHHPAAAAQLVAEREQTDELLGPECWVSRVPVEAHSTRWTAQRTIERLETCRHDDFFIWCSFPDPHHPFAPPEPYARRYDPNDMPLPARRPGEFEDRPPHYARFHREGLKYEGTPAGVVHARTGNDQLRRITAHYYGATTLVDDAIGEILRALERLGLSERTAVVFTSDHGELLGDHGFLFKGPFPYEGLIRTPLIWSLPRTPTPRSSPALVSQVDVAPTLLELAGIDPLGLPGVQGRSLAPLLAGERDAHRAEAVVGFHSYDHPRLNFRTLVTERWKLTEYGEADWGELVDLQEDPHEFRNLYHDSGHAAVRGRLQRRLLKELIAQADVLPPRLANS